MQAANANIEAIVTSDARTQSKKPYTPPFPPLDLVTKPGLTTTEIAYYTNQAEQTWRVHACYETYPEGLRPRRIGNRLNWPTAGAKKLLGVAQ